MSRPSVYRPFPSAAIAGAAFSRARGSRRQAAPPVAVAAEAPRNALSNAALFSNAGSAFGAFDHLFPRIRSDGHSESHPDSRMQFTPILDAVIPQVFDSMRYGNGIKGS
jgi:hypothetical protein